MPSTRAPYERTAWLGLGAASDLLGVDPDTLRRWADSGRVEVFHTPGGHRRFSRHALGELVRAGTRDRATLAGLGATPRRLLGFGPRLGQAVAELARGRHPEIAR